MCKDAPSGCSCRLCWTLSAEFVAELQVRYSPERFLKESLARERRPAIIFMCRMLCKEENASHSGVKGECALSKTLQRFHPVSGFPPDKLNDPFEDIVPVELSSCIREMIRDLKYFTLYPKHKNVHISISAL